MTTARRAIVEAFGHDCNPLSAQEVHAMLRGQKVAANVTTVYRELQFLADQEILRAVQFEDGVQRFEFAEAGHHHHHLICLKCSEVEDVHVEDDLEDMERAISKQKQFTVLRHSLEFYGHCKRCR